MALKLWITGGGTREPIDAVRYLGNHSTGRMAAQVTAEALRRGHAVASFLGRDAVSAPPHDRLEVRRHGSAAELAHNLLEDPAALRAGPPDAIVHAAAVSDYVPDAETGKVESGRPEWILRLHPAPKIAPQLRERFPAAVLVLFKLESDLTADELRRRARQAAGRAGAQLVFANLLEEVRREHAGWLLRCTAAGEGQRLVGRQVVAAGILDAVESLLPAGHTAREGGNE